MALNPSPQRQSVITFPTPNVGDILFFETVDAERIGINIPEYGTKHPDYKKWPNHRLVHAESADDQSRYYRFYYAADQEGQDDDNWSFGQADIGNTKFDSVSRRYVIRRTEFDPQSPAMGSAMPDVPEGKFTGSYVLAERRQQPTGDKILDGLYVIEERVYVKNFTQVGVQESESGVTYPTTIDLYYRGQVPSEETLTIEALFADPDDRYWGLQSGGISRNGKQISDNWYVVQTGPSKDIQTRYALVSDNMKPDKFYCPKNNTTNTAIEILNSIDTPDAPTATAGQRIEINQVGYIRTTVTTTQVGTTSDLKGSDFDERTGKSFVETSTLVSTSAVAQDEIDNSGSIDLYTPYDACHSIKRTVQVVDPASVTWTEIINYEWPPVLKSLTVEGWPRRDGTSQFFPNVKLKQAFNGPQLVTVTQSWQKTAPSITQPARMIPEGFTFASPIYNLQVPPCLHGAITLTVSTGTTDPTWKYIVKQETFAATNYTDWPSTITWQDVKPWRGGYLVTTYTLPKPS